VLDTNVRRVLARAVRGEALPPVSVTRAERDLAESLVPDREPARWAVAVMELGALVCTATRPRCAGCPVADRCVWRIAGSPSYDGPPRRVQAWAGTDRQCRGALLAVLRDADGAVGAEELEAAWPDAPQRARALTSLLDDGLVVGRAGQGYSLPG